MTKRSFPDFVMATRFFHSADIAELQDALSGDERETRRPRQTAPHATPTRRARDAGGGKPAAPGEPIPLHGAAGRA